MFFFSICFFLCLFLLMHEKAIISMLFFCKPLVVCCFIHTTSQTNKLTKVFCYFSMMTLLLQWRPFACVSYAQIGYNFPMIQGKLLVDVAAAHSGAREKIPFQKHRSSGVGRQCTNNARRLLCTQNMATNRHNGLTQHCCKNA